MHHFAYNTVVMLTFHMRKLRHKSLDMFLASLLVSAGARTWAQASPRGPGSSINVSSMGTGASCLLQKGGVNIQDLNLQVMSSYTL